MNDAVQTYLRVRQKEGRLYPDSLVQHLPEVPPGHPYSAEWSARAASCERLVRHIRARWSRPVGLDLGCGNGWLSHRIVCATDATVVGIDLNEPELQQAHRVFSGFSTLSWLSADIFSAPVEPSAFDFIILASVIQYFADLRCLVESLRKLLAVGGEIHILDSPLYAEHEVPAARERSRKYYASLSFPEMADYYHHHSRNALDAYQPTWLYLPQPRSGTAAGYNDSPFPWICVRR